MLLPHCDRKAGSESPRSTSDATSTSQNRDRASSTYGLIALAVACTDAKWACARSLMSVLTLALTHLPV